MSIRTPVYYKIYDPDRFGFAVYYDAGDQAIDPKDIIEALNTAAADREKLERIEADIQRAIYVGKESRIACLEQLYELLDREFGGEKNEGK